MGKRSDFERHERDYYRTPPSAVAPLLAHLPIMTHFIEPCAGDGALIDALEAVGHKCVCCRHRAAGKQHTAKLLQQDAVYAKCDDHHKPAVDKRYFSPNYCGADTPRATSMVAGRRGLGAHKAGQPVPANVF